jgi:hypothetical protein
LLIVPELHAIFIMPPRTGSDSLCIELMKAHPNAFLLYRHGEAELIPPGYTNWKAVGFVRHPLARLWSIYKYCAIVGSIAEDNVAEALKAEIKLIRDSVEGKSFEQWVLTNDVPLIPAATKIPFLYQADHTPENRRSQAQYLRPDLDTVILKFQDLRTHMAAWGLNPETHSNASPHPEVPKPTRKLTRWMKKHMPWELGLGLELV